MKKKILRIVAIVMLLTILSQNVYADTPNVYQFETWRGEGDTTVVMPGYGEFKVSSLKQENVNIDEENFSMEVQDRNLLLTLKEQFLETLEDKQYEFVLQFEGKPTSYEYGTEVSVDADGFPISISGVDMTTFDKLLCGEEEITPESYTATTTEDSILIVFKEEYRDYVDELNAKNQIFYMVFVQPQYVKLYLDVNTTAISGDVDADGTVTLKDAQLILRAALLLEDLLPEEREIADVVADESVDLKDAQKCLRKALLLE